MKKMGFNKDHQLFDPSAKHNIDKIPICTVYPPPLTDLADFSDLIKWEKWSTIKEKKEMYVTSTSLSMLSNPKDSPKTCLYWCGPKLTPLKPVPFEDTDYPKRATIQCSFGNKSFRILVSDFYLLSVEAEAAQSLRSAMGGILLPDAAQPYQPYGFDFNHLSLAYVDPLRDDNHGANRMKQQWIRANVDPTERYVPAFPGQAKHRFHAWESGYYNLTLGTPFASTARLPRLRLTQPFACFRSWRLDVRRLCVPVSMDSACSNHFHS